MALDKTPAMEALGVTEPELDELLLEFVQLAKAELDSIRSGLEKNCFDGMDRRAHSIRGMAANLRLELCRNRASRLETDLLSRDAHRAAEAVIFLAQAINVVKEAATGG